MSNTNLTIEQKQEIEKILKEKEAIVSKIKNKLERSFICEKKDENEKILKDDKEEILCESIEKEFNIKTESIGYLNNDLYTLKLTTDENQTQKFQNKTVKSEAIKNSDKETLIKESDSRQQIIINCRASFEIILNKLVIEFLTYNMYVLFKRKLIEDVLDEKQRLDDMKEEIENFENFDEQKSLDLIYQKIRENFLNENLIQTVGERFLIHTIKLRKLIVETIHQKFLKIFGGDLPERSKFKLHLSGNQNKGKETKVVISLKNNFFRLFRKFTIFYIFFPCLLYNQDFEDIKPNSLRYKFTKDQTILNKAVKSLAGILGAWLITYILYFYLRYQLKLDPNSTGLTLLVSFVLLLVGLGLNNRKFRCIVLLVIPCMASNRGRAIILMRCYSLATKVILPNIIHNLKALTFSYSCNRRLFQKLVLGSASHSSFVRSFKSVVQRARQQSHKIQQGLNVAKKTFKKSLSHIQKAQNSLKNYLNFCASSFSQPSSKCKQAQKEFYVECAYKPIYSIVQLFCSFASSYVYDACIALDKAKAVCAQATQKIGKHIDSLQDKTAEEWDMFIDEKIDSIENEFKFDYEYRSNKTDDTKIFDNYEMLGANISATYNKRLEYITYYSVYIDFVFPATFVFVILSAFLYHRKYLIRDKYENNIIGVKFHELDEKRQRQGQEPLLPLNELLKSKYSHLFSIKINSEERKDTLNSMMVLFSCLIPIISVILLDYLVYGACEFVMENTEISFKATKDLNQSSQAKKSSNMFSLHAYLFNSINKVNSKFEFSNKECLPEPKLINKETHDKIQINIIILFIFVCFEPYIKRLRSVFAGCVYPERDHERTVWLYNHLFQLSSKIGAWSTKTEKIFDDDSLKTKKLQIIYANLRTSLMSLLRKLSYSFFNIIYMASMTICLFYCCCSIKQMTLAKFYYEYEYQILVIYLKLKNLIKKSEKIQCILCLDQLKKNENDEDFIKCESTIKCKGFYCLDCYNKLENVCKLCHMHLLIDETASNGESMETGHDEEILYNKKGLKFLTFNDDQNSYEKDNLEFSRKLVNEIEIRMEEFDKLLEIIDEEDNFSYLKTKNKPTKTGSNGIIELENSRINKVIDSNFKLLYYELKPFFKESIYKDLIANSHNFYLLNNKEFEIKFRNQFESMVKIISKNLLEKISLNDLFE